VQQIDAGHQLEQLAAEMLEAADADRGILQLARLLLGGGQQLLDRMHRQLRIDDQDIGAGGENGDRRERFDRIVRQLVEPGIDRVRERDDQQRVAVMG